VKRDELDSEGSRLVQRSGKVENRFGGPSASSLRPTRRSYGGLRKIDVEKTRGGG
jgi:hypothetical protein